MKHEAAGVVNPLVIDPTNNRVYLTDGTQIRAAIVYSTQADIGGSNVSGIIFYDSSGVVRAYLYYDSSNDAFAMRAFSKVATGARPAADFAITGSVNGGLTLKLRGLPSVAGATPGNVWLNGKVLTVVDEGTQQVETATVAETVEGTLTAGNVVVIVTGAGIAGSPVTLPVAVETNAASNHVAALIRSAIAANAAISTVYVVYPGDFGIGADDSHVTVKLTKITAAANDATLNIDIADDTSVGIAAAHTSANTTAGAVPS